MKPRIEPCGSLFRGYPRPISEKEQTSGAGSEWPVMSGQEFQNRKDRAAAQKSTGNIVDFQWTDPLIFVNSVTAIPGLVVFA
jgi:hypothetical protein